MPAGKMKYKQLLNNFWGDIHSFAKQFWGNSKMSIVYKKKSSLKTPPSYMKTLERERILYVRSYRNYCRRK